ncbi:MAG TPA: DUF1343 domain-containing protein [Pseudonocardiaceae bacterium]
MNPLNRRRFLTASALAAPALTVAAGVTGATGAAAAPASSAPAKGPRPGHQVLTGAARLAQDNWRLLVGRKVGMVTNPTGILPDLVHVVDAMHTDGRARPVAVFGPEHGFRGTAQAGGSEGDYIDPRTGIPVYDTYGAGVDKIAEMFRKSGLDTVVFDIADVGARFYTYIWTMYQTMQAAVAVGASFVVLDRPNPVGGQAHGPQLDPAYSSFVGLRPVVQQHGMTIGELARLFDAEFLPADTGRRLEQLEVVELRGWKRSDLFDATGLPWVPPSPNMPTPDTALVYPGTCMFEGTVFSEGRGTTRPFELIGAPGLDWRWAEELNGMNLPGVSFREAYFTPTFSKHANTVCGGVQLHLTDPARFDAVRTGTAMIVTARRLYPDVFAWRSDNWIDKLTGSDRFRRMVDAGAGVDEVVDAWKSELAEFRRRREPYLLYR